MELLSKGKYNSSTVQVQFTVARVATIQFVSQLPSGCGTKLIVQTVVTNNLIVFYMHGAAV